MRRFVVGLSCLALTGCGGGSGSGSGSIGTPAPAPTPSPTASPTPSPSPTPSYSRLSDLTGDQNFRTACAAIDLAGAVPVPVPATAYGDGLSLAYAAGTQTYAVGGDGVALSFGPNERDTAAPPSTESYVRVIGGVNERLSMGRPSPAGVPLDYARGFVLGTRRSTATLRQYYCLYGVPTLATDLPAATMTYTRFGLNGVAYVGGAGGGLRTYAVDQSVTTIAYDATARRVTLTIRLVGTPLPATTPATTVELGTYTGTATVDAARQTFGGAMTSTDRSDVFATFGGWFFGPQAREAGMSVSIFAADPTVVSSRVSFIGNATAAR